MKKSEYEDILKTLLDPDKLAEGLTQLNDKLTSDELEFNKLKDSNDALRDTNAKLALRITTPVENKDTSEEVDLFQQLIEDVNKEV